MITVDLKDVLLETQSKKCNFVFSLFRTILALGLQAPILMRQPDNNLLLFYPFLQHQVGKHSISLRSRAHTQALNHKVTNNLATHEDPMKYYADKDIQSDYLSHSSD